MDVNTKKLIQLRTKFKFYKKLNAKIDKIMNAALDIEDYSNEVYSKMNMLENELTDLKCEMDLSDEEWDEDESN